MADFERELAFLVRVLEAAQRRSPLPMERAHYLLLGILEADGPQPVGALARRLLLDQSTATRQIAVMEGLGLVKKVAHPGDGRSALIRPTAAGLRQARAMRDERRARVTRLAAGWSMEEIAAAAATLGKLNQALTAWIGEEDAKDAAPLRATAAPPPP